MEESWRRKWKVVRKGNVIVWKGILFLFSVSWHHSTLLQTHFIVNLQAHVLPGHTISSVTAESSLSKPKSVRNSRHITSSETLCVLEKLFVNRIVHDPRRSWTEVWLYSCRNCPVLTKLGCIDRFCGGSKYQISRKFVQWEPRWYIRAGGRTDGRMWWSLQKLLTSIRRRLKIPSQDSRWPSQDSKWAQKGSKPACSVETYMGCSVQTVHFVCQPSRYLSILVLRVSDIQQGILLPHRLMTLFQLSQYSD